MREAHIRRYQVAIAFLILTVSFVIAVIALERNVHETRATQRRISSVRTEQLRILQETNRASCHSRHLLTQALLVSLSTSYAADLKFLRTPPPGYTRAQVVDALANARRLISGLHRADCVHVPSLPASPAP